MPWPRTWRRWRAEFSLPHRQDGIPSGRSGAAGEPGWVDPPPAGWGTVFITTGEGSRPRRATLRQRWRPPGDARLRRPTQPRPQRNRPNVSPSLAAGNARSSRYEKELTWNRGSGSSSRSASSSCWFSSSGGPEGAADEGSWFGARVAGPDGADGVARVTVPPSRPAPPCPGRSGAAVRGALLRGIDFCHCAPCARLPGRPRGASSNVGHHDGAAAAAGAVPGRG